MSFYPERHVLCVPMSFETNLQTTTLIPFASKVQITRVSAQVNKALAGTDAGTIAIKNDDASVTHDTLSFPASSALAATDESSFASDVFVDAGEELQLISSKSTAGGTVLCFVEYQNISS